MAKVTAREGMGWSRKILDRPPALSRRARDRRTRVKTVSDGPSTVPRTTDTGVVARAEARNAFLPDLAASV